MRPPEFKPGRLRKSTADAVATDAQREFDKLADEFDLIKLVPFLAGRQISVTLAAGTPTQIPHGLGRAWAGYIVTRGQTVAILQATSADPTRYLALTCASAIPIDVWVW